MFLPKYEASKKYEASNEILRKYPLYWYPSQQKGPILRHFSERLPWVAMITVNTSHYSQSLRLLNDQCQYFPCIKGLRRCIL